MKNLQVTFTNLNDNNQELFVQLEGRLGDMNAYDFKTDLLNIIKEKNVDCTIDLTTLTSMDIIGINALVIAHKELNTNGLNLTIMSKPESSIDRVFHLTKMDQILNLKRA